MTEERSSLIRKVHTIVCLVSRDPGYVPPDDVIGMRDVGVWGMG
ncbi:hypothetical protein [Alicyclobacillus fastidiosus]|uniref:Uncharacterized protein n=1 Tax=Alicyclobacillus fastidiosus TaxID=392011 RepID=A0ABV5ACL1_9BACL|nr:hypothetical protein [Alicyclobacillus fastidiosus]WEH11361.1 hypothetical protein PYS47_09180 [Alicyclobacillus fastidiosus]